MLKVTDGIRTHDWNVKEQQNGSMNLIRWGASFVLVTSEELRYRTGKFEMWVQTSYASGHKRWSAKESISSAFLMLLHHDSTVIKVHQHVGVVTYPTQIP